MQHWMYLCHSLSLLLVLQVTGVTSTCGYESCNAGKDGMTNVHLIPHTHDDVGWLRTVDQYYTYEVQYILDSVILSLQQNPSRKFSYVEMAFFYRWWMQQDEPTKQTVQRLVMNGQLSFVLGGWCMNDEASTHYTAIIDQHTLGVRFLNETFGECGRPLAAWQIDPFGHSREQANLFAQMGYDAVYFARIDYQDYNWRNTSKQLEMIWRGSDDFQSELFTGALYAEQYGAPAGMDFDIHSSSNSIQDDKRLHDFNVEEVVDLAIKEAQQQETAFQGSHIAWLMGDDFNYQNANTWFKNMDKLITYVNARQANGSNVNMFYSTPACYTLAKNKASLKWPIKSDDFFPYAHRPHAYWTGYFTSRAALKGMVRRTNSFLQAVQQLNVLAQMGEDKKLNMFKQAMGVAQHHDAVSGTAKQAVTFDYAQRLSEGIGLGLEIANKLFNNTLAIPYSLCPLVNISSCNAIEGAPAIILMVYNPLAVQTDAWFQVPVNATDYIVGEIFSDPIEAQIIPVSSRTMKIPERNGSIATYDVVFKASLPPLNAAIILVALNASANKWTSFSRRIHPRGDTVISNKYIQLTFDGQTGLLKQFYNVKSSIKSAMSQQLMYYPGMRGNNSDSQFTASGAYLFRPNGTEPIPLSSKADIQIIQGSLVQEVRQTFVNWCTNVFRLKKGEPWVEMEWTVGPIPYQNDMVGKEVISRITSDLDSQGVFYTDANGRQMLQRTKDFRPTWKLDVNEPVAGNYYPVNSRIFIQDLKRAAQLTVLTDRSQGGSSLQSGSIELMLHRVTLDDDSLGVGEPLQEKGSDGNGLIVRGCHYLILDTIADSARLHRELAQRLFMVPLIMYAVPSSKDIQLGRLRTSEMLPQLHSLWSRRFVSTILPENVHLLTLDSLGPNVLLLRLEHFYSKGEDAVLSQNATVSLSDFLAQLLFEISGVKELTLEGNQYLENSHRLVWNSQPAAKPKPLKDDLLVELSPMMIRTFEITYVSQP